MAEHKWNLSWPGNFCRKCGADDPMELCVADGHDTFVFDDNGNPIGTKPCPEGCTYKSDCPVEDADDRSVL